MEGDGGRKSIMRKVILVTGASAGIGREAAILLAREGHTVYAGARRLDRLEELTEHRSPRTR